MIDTTRAVINALFAAPECADSPEPGRACRYCEADYLVMSLPQDVLLGWVQVAKGGDQ